MQLKTSAPGSLMLLGEYAVLHGKQALVCAIDKRIFVTLTPRSDKKIELYSNSVGEYKTELSQLKIEKPFQFVLGVLHHYHAKLRYGCRIEIESEFSDKMGLGTSAAVTVATLAALIAWLTIRISSLDFLRQARHIIRTVQGVGSGADVAASLYGGMVSYQAQPLFAEKLTNLYPLTVLYAGFKTPTVDAIKKVQQSFSGYTNLFRHITNSIGQCATEGIQFVRKTEWDKLGVIMNIQQGMMESLGVNTAILNTMIEALRKQKGILGAKISGSGLGDCVVGLGESEEFYDYTILHPGVQKIPLSMSAQGVLCEKI